MLSTQMRAPAMAIRPKMRWWLEARKMERTLTAPADGTVKTVRYAVGEQVVEGAELVEFEAG